MLEKYFGYPKGTLRGCEITNSVVINSEILNGKKIEMDIKVKLPNNSMVNLEFYSVYDKASEAKSFIYITKMFGGQLKRGEEYDKIRKVKQINFIYEDRLRNDDKVIKRYAVINREDPFDYIMQNSFEVDIINLANKRELAYNGVNEGLVDWILFMGAKDYEEMKKYSKGKPILEEALKEMERFSNDEDVSEYFTRDILDRTRENFAKKDGIEEGIEIGKEKGLKEGAKEKSIEIAKKMLDKKMDIKEIAELVGLPIKKIKELQTKEDE